MKKVRTAFMSVSASAAAVLWFAAAASAATRVWHISTILSVYPYADGTIVFTFASDSPSCPATSSPNQYFYARVGENGLTQQGLDNILSTGLAAAAAGVRVAVNFDADTNYCYINRLRAHFAES